MAWGVEEDAVENGCLTLTKAARLSGFVINPDKSQLPGPEVTAFNIVLTNGSIAIADDRMIEFEKDILQSAPSAAAGMIAYVRSVNQSQAVQMVEVALTSANEGVREAAAKFA